MAGAPRARRRPGVARAIDRLLPGQRHARGLLRAAAEPGGIRGLRVQPHRAKLRRDPLRGHFYDALFQAVTGDAATRSARFMKGIQEVLETRAGHYYEYLLARYLRSRG